MRHVPIENDTGSRSPAPPSPTAVYQRLQLAQTKACTQQPGCPRLNCRYRQLSGCNPELFATERGRNPTQGPEWEVHQRAAREQQQSTLWRAPQTGSGSLPMATEPLGVSAGLCQPELQEGQFILRHKPCAAREVHLFYAHPAWLRLE